MFRTALALCLLFSSSQISAAHENGSTPPGRAWVAAGSELKVALPTIATQRYQTDRFRGLSFANMSSRSLAKAIGDVEDGSALLILQSHGEIVVQKVSSPRDAIFARESGLLIWSDQGREQWKYHVAPTERRSETGDETLLLAGGERSDNGSRPLVGSLTPTNPLQQLAGLSLVRGSPNMAVGKPDKPAVPFVTPLADVECLNPNITIRRAVDAKGDFPEIGLELIEGKLGNNDGTPVLTFKFPAGREALLWSEIPELPEKYRNGLPPGNYTLTTEDNRGAINGFSVGDPDTHAGFSNYFDKIIPAELGLPRALKTLVTVEALLGFEDEVGRPSPYLCDALDAIELLERSHVGPGLDLIRQAIRSQTGNGEMNLPDPYRTGIKAVDKARQQIAQGRWSTAEQTLERAEPTTQREKGLVRLYQATIFAESGITGFSKAKQNYIEAINLLRDEQPLDSWRAYNNYGVLLLNTAQDLLNNHALQIASGVRSPLSAALVKWQEAQEAFADAAFVAEQVNSATLANVHVNQARLNAVMADLLATFVMSSQSDIDRQKQLISVAQQSARQSAAPVAEQTELDPITRGAACEILAQVAFRERDLDRSYQFCERALKDYVDAGSLAGAESAVRLRGMIQLVGDERLKELGLKSLQVSEEIGDILYQRIPGDETGRSKAGFFSRRAYVTSRIVQELIRRGELEQALEYAESAKARSLKEVLATRSLQLAEENVDPETRSLREIVHDLPHGTVVLEYFMGPEDNFAFLVSSEGVKVERLANPDGTPLNTQQLIASVVELQSKMGHQAKKMLVRIREGKPLDHQWQHDLHRLYGQLIPNQFADEIRSAKSLVIIPQHVLHYVPYAALVTEIDDAPNRTGRPQHYEGRRYGGMAQPKFLLDDGINISVAPSLGSWDLLRRRSQPVESAAAIGIAEFANAQALPGVEKDLRNFRAIFGDSVQILPGSSASEENVLEMLNQPGVLMFATHGVNLADNPLESFLLCHPSDNLDGLLTAREVFQTEVKAEMVVMSACYTGLADRSPLPGDDLFGLQRAFLVAGSSTVVSGLWDVYDGTGPTLMQGFFERFERGARVDSSLADTQRAFLGRLRESEQVEFFLHPYFWAVYNISGDGAMRFREEDRR